LITNFFLKSGMINAETTTAIRAATIGYVVFPKEEGKVEVIVEQVDC